MTTADPGSDDVLRLVGEVAGRRVLELGLGDGSRATGLATRGATVIGVDVDPGAVAAASAAATAAEARIELHRVADLADLAFLRADSVDLALSAEGLGGHPDLARVCRQVHRVLRPGGVFVLALPHPAALCVTQETAGPATAEGEPALRLRVTRSYFDATPLPVPGADPATVARPRTVAEAFGALRTAGFRPDVLVEVPAAPPASLLPAVMLWRARKEGA